MFHHDVYPEARLVVLTLRGSVTTQDFLDCIDGYLGDPRYQPEFCGVVDIREADYDSRRVDPQVIAERVAASGRVRGQWVALAREPIETALAMLYEQAIEATHPFKTCYTLDAAGDFLEVDLHRFLEERLP